MGGKPHMGVALAGSQPGPTDRAFGWQFGLIMLIVGLAAILLRDAFDLVSALFFLLGAVFLVVSASVPYVLGPINRGWARLGRLVAYVSNPLILGVLYVLVILPVAILGKVFKRDELALRKRDVEPFWTLRDAREGTWQDYFRRQF